MLKNEEKGLESLEVYRLAKKLNNFITTLRNKAVPVLAP